MKEKLYTIEELRGILKLHPKTIIRFIHEGKIKGHKIGRAWMVSEADLKIYVHGELAEKNNEESAKTDYSTIGERITVSTVIEITEQNSEEASRISNSIMAMLNGYPGDTIQSRFDFIYDPELKKSKYIVYGAPSVIIEIIKVFDVLAKQKET